MKQYIGTKLVAAEPAERITNPAGHVSYRKEGTNGPTETGSKIEAGYRVRYADGYESWSPREVFEEAYREVDGMNFGLALEAAKVGYRIARKGWNGSRMYVFLAKEPDFNTPQDISEFEDTAVAVPDCLGLRTAQGELQLGWLASQADLLAEDWYILPEDLEEQE